MKLFIDKFFAWIPIVVPMIVVLSVILTIIPYLLGYITFAIIISNIVLAAMCGIFLLTCLFVGIGMARGWDK